MHPLPLLHPLYRLHRRFLGRGTGRGTKMPLPHKHCLYLFEIGRMKEQTKIPSPEIPGIRNTKESQGKMPRLSNFLWERGGKMTTTYPDFSSLTTKELLAITLRESCTSEAVDELSQHFTLKELTEATVSEVSALKGMGKRRPLCPWHPLN